MSSGLLSDPVALTLGQDTNDHNAYDMDAALRVLWCPMLSMGALGMAYLSRAVWKMGRLSEGLASLRSWS
jgi:hypothetical protein